MQIGNRILITGVLALLVVSLSAQNGTNSPYTRYGYGELSNRSFGAGRAMGGIGIGLRSSKQINPINPASYSCMDSLTFLFDVGATMQYSWYKDRANTQNDINGNINYIAMQFPLSKKIAMSAGLLPYSEVGYNFGQTKMEGNEPYYEQFKGTGGLNLLYAGLSIELWKKRLSVGTNINYLFGSIEHNTLISYSSTSSTPVNFTQQFKFSNALFDFGMQYTHPLSKTDNLVMGLTYTPKKRMVRDTYETLYSTESVTDTINGAVFNLPQSLGIGLSYVRNNQLRSKQLIVAADYQFQAWNKATFNGTNDQFKNRSKFIVGIEYIPLLNSGPLFKRVSYRAGLSYADSYIQMNGKGYSEFCASTGLGFPISDKGSYINVSFEYLNIKPELVTMIKENYLRMTLSFTFNELWFFKAKVY